ncbi:MAG: helix-turn-helix transcriptional regulator [Ponticaulis sp.]|nr:helix-turn-helix transcriptional regulator [Ponticaulis sp.]|tara:strand:- start:71183 stop:71653 length:471 start_codon:yes stop_codon:yes gene_type:complete
MFPEIFRRKKKSLPGAPLGQLLIYGGLLAAGALVLQWLDLTGMTRQHPMEIQITLLAVLFLGLGIWVGARVFASHGTKEADAEPGNPKAQAALGISARELEVLELLASGLSNKEIARKLNISPNTIKTHITRLLEKLDASRRTEAIARARELGLIH